MWNLLFKMIMIISTKDYSYPKSKVKYSVLYMGSLWLGKVIILILILCVKVWVNSRHFSGQCIPYLSSSRNFVCYNLRFILCAHLVTCVCTHAFVSVPNGMPQHDTSIMVLETKMASDFCNMPTCKTHNKYDPVPFSHHILACLWSSTR